MSKWIAGLLAASLGCGGAAFADGVVSRPADLKPLKVTSAEALSSVFSRPTVVKENGVDGPTSDYPMLKSRDGKLEAGVFAAGPSDYAVASYEEDEFMFFLEGGVVMTSADGTVLEAKAGEAVVVPKGWKGRWTTKGYKKYYVTYSGGSKPK